MSDDPVIRLDDVWLCYRLAKQRIPSLKEYAIRWLRGGLEYTELWALRGLSCDIRRGERVGIIGANGTGKSTLLAVISGVLEPSRGVVEVRGHVAPILGLGMGFDYELTGVENIYLNALLLGHRKVAIDDKLDWIIEFAELGQFIRSPLHSYSTGMLARLGFAIATAWSSDILILDEVFAVGDAHFVERSKLRLLELREQATAMLLVSHTPSVISETCERCLWLDGGTIVADGPADEVLAAYGVSRQAS